MALSDRHLVAATVAACAFIAAAKLPPDSEPRSRRARPAPEILVQDRARVRLRQASDKLALLERRDAALAIAARSPAASATGPRVLYDRDVPRELRAKLDSMVRRETDAMRTPLDALPVLVYVELDTARGGDDGLPGRSRARWIESEYVLPAAADGRTCISIVRVGDLALDDSTRRNGRRFADIARDGAAGELLGPCAYLGAHGMPGPGVERWLARASFGLALRSPAPETDTLRTSRATFRGRHETIVEVLLRSAGWSIQRDWLHPDIVACAAGTAARCLAAVGADGVEAAPVRVPGLLRSSGVPFDRDWRTFRRSKLETAGLWLLASLHDEVGPEAFGRFWSSELPPEQAWMRATGTPLSGVIEQWMIEAFDVGSARRWPSPGLMLLQLALVAAAVGGAMVLRQRRTLAA